MLPPPPIFITGGERRSGHRCFVWYFVWQVERAGEEEPHERSLLGELEAGLIAVEEGQGGRRSEFLEGRGHLSNRIGGGGRVGGGGVGGVVDHAGFNGPRVTEAPRGSGDLFDGIGFQVIGRLQAFHVMGEEFIERLNGFRLEDEAASEQPVADGVAGRTLPAFGGDRILRASAIGAGSENSSEG